MSRSEIRIAGSGGQGVVTAGRILAEAAILCGRKATHSQVYGPQSRGGASRSDVVIDTREIGFPLAENPDLLIILSTEAYAKYRPDLGENGRLLGDSGCVPPSGDGELTGFPVVDVARSISGGVLATGVVALGVLQAFAEIVELEALREAVAKGVPPKHKEMNLKAFEAGLQLVVGASA